LVENYTNTKKQKESKMKNAFLILGIVLVFALSASAQIATPLSFYAGGAISMPNSPDGFNDGYKMGWHGLAGVGYKFAPMFQVMGKLEYHDFAADLEGLPLDGGNTKVTMFGADARYSMNMPTFPLKPFFFGGAGLAHLKLDEFEGPTLMTPTLNVGLPYTQDKMYWNIGAGLDFKTGPAWGLFVQGRYVNIATEGESVSFIPVTVGVKFF